MPSHLAIFCDGGPNVGYGHIRRCLTLLERLLEGSVDASIHGLSHQAEKLLSGRRGARGDYGAILLDSPHNIDQRLRNEKQEGKLTIALDYFGSEEPDINIVVFEHAQVKGKAKYIGFDYQMIRGAITGLEKPDYCEGVLITIGGGDLLKQGEAAAKLVGRAGEAATLVKGPLSDTETSQGGYKVIVQPRDFEQRLNQSRWVVTNGGGCMFEAMHLGKAAVILPQTKEEQRVAEEFLHRGAILGIGLEAIHYYGEKHLKRIGETAKQCIDGLGVERVYNIVGGFL